MKKRMLSALLALCMFLSLCPAQPASAASQEPVGELRLAIRRPEAAAGTQFTAVLAAEGTTLCQDVFQAQAGRMETTLFWTGIPDGTYTLTLTAPGYLPLSQTLEFDGRCIQLTYYNNVSVNDERSGEDTLYGVFPVGDLNGDGVIDDEDAQCMTDAVASGDSAFDLTGDGLTDLADLTVVVRNQGACQQAAPVHTVSSKVLEAAASASSPADTTVTGDPKDLLDQSNEEAVVGLSPADGSAISPDTPVELSLESAIPQNDPALAPVQAEALVIAPPPGSQNLITGGTVQIDGLLADGAPVSLSGIISAPTSRTFYASPDADAEVTVEEDGTIVIDLGSRVAIKKVTIRVTETANQGNLAEIAKVEFLSDYAERIPEPQLSIPTVTAVSNTESDGQGYKNLTVSWTPQPNVTGYEVSVSGPGYNKTATTSQTSHTFQGDSFNGTVLSFRTYTIRVRSVSGDWRSDWSEPYSHTVTCSKVPPAPQYLSVTPAVASLKVSWNCKFDAESFSLYYREASSSDFLSVTGLTASSYTIPNLKGGVKYIVYVVAHNRNGASPKSANAEGTPLTSTAVEMPKYKLLNVDDADGAATTHILSVYGNSNKSYTIYRSDGTSVPNTTATPEDWKAILDNDPNSYLLIPDWDSGVVYSNFRGPIVTLDRRYTMDTIRMSPNAGATVHMTGVSVSYKDETGALKRINDVSFSLKYDRENRLYYEAVLASPITTDYLEIRTRSYNQSNYTICELKLYLYDDLEHCVADLFSDEMRTFLREDVTEADIRALLERLDTPDPVSGELHPHRSTILADLQYALQMLSDSASLAQIGTVDNQITATGAPASGFAQALSDYQPLGFVAAAGDTVVIYVSDADGRTSRGSYVNLNLVCTQYHPEVAAWQSSAVRLKAGRNEITVPKISSLAQEKGGSLYLQYTGAKGAQNYLYRVSGATPIPVLRLDGVTGSDRRAAVEAYVACLETYVAGLEAGHADHQAGDNPNTQYAYDKANCFLNSTELTMENMMYSLPATQVYSALGSGDRVGRLLDAIEAMEQQIDYFYQFKGLNKASTDADAYPNTRLNIRYHRMFTGAFMYAGGKHIGIEFGSVSNLFSLHPVTTDEQGRKTGGSLSGWGIAHEIGHCINAAAYQRVEVTNNLFAQLTATDETSASFRTSYDNVYKAVATGTTGHTGSLSVQLAMYWQLHLAYDDDYTFRVYDSAREQLAGLFYARLESYLRTRSKAPYPFTASSGDQLFMQASCAAAGRDILSFFRAWGFTPDPSTVAYASQFPAETRKIQYIDDSSRLYRMEGGSGMSAGTTVSAAITNAQDSRINGSRVTIALSNDNQAPDAMLGYEICRNGKMVAFVTADKTGYTDVITTENNKAFVYTVTGVDRLLRETETVTLPEVKVCHDGAIGKGGWSASTNMVSPRDTVVEKDDNDPESGAMNGSVKPGVETLSALAGAVLDNDLTTVYYGAASGSRPYIILDLGGVEQVTALKITPAPQDYAGNASEGTAVSPADLYKYRVFGYQIEVSLDGESWQTVKTGTSYTGSAADPSSWVRQEDVLYNDADGSYTLYFNRTAQDGSLDPFMYTYDAAYIRLTSTNMSSLALAELDVLGPTSDNVDLIPAGYGILGETYTAGSYADGTPCLIPKGSLVFYGAYKGDPSYNVVLLKDQNGKVIDGSQLIFAQVPDKGALGETCDGRWFYWLEDAGKTDDLGQVYNEMDQLASLTHVKAELYRVQDALTLAGQRLTSTSLTMALPDTPPVITITASGAQGEIFVPDAGMVEAARAWVEAPQAAQASVCYVPAGGVYADTGAGQQPPYSPVRLEAGSTAVSFTVKPDDISIAAQVVLTAEPAQSSFTVSLDAPASLFAAYRCDAAAGTLTLFTVARRGCIGDGTLTGWVRCPGSTYTLSASAMYELDSSYASACVEVNAQASFASSGGSGGSGSLGGGGVSSPTLFTLTFQTNGGTPVESLTLEGGTQVDLTRYVTTREGFTFAGWYADAALTRAVTSLTLTGPSTVYAGWTAAAPFPDVEAGSWYEDAAAFVKEKGLINGTQGGLFSPYLTTSRAMVVTILWRLAGTPDAARPSGFSDVAPGSYYAKAVAWAAECGIATGYSDGRFAPDDPVTREQLATFFQRYARYVGRDTSAQADLSGYADLSAVSPYALEAMAWANAASLVTGTPAATLSPTRTAVRAEVAVILLRFCKGA